MYIWCGWLMLEFLLTLNMTLITVDECRFFLHFILTDTLSVRNSAYCCAALFCSTYRAFKNVLNMSVCAEYAERRNRSHRPSENTLIKLKSWVLYGCFTLSLTSASSCKWITQLSPVNLDWSCPLLVDVHHYISVCYCFYQLL